ncbi:uncharacterized protein [Clytia hemisphaerica]|uniref:uncharacterized protein n=1 Tax=Clytia hemisphaerica TaxID=252671 RepID=UPI0034D77AD9
MLLVSLKTALILIFFQFALSRMLKFQECNLFDAEFSVVTRHHILLLGGQGFRFQRVPNMTLLNCLNMCMYHPKCFSVNHSPSTLTCQLLGNAAYMCGGRYDLLYDSDWNHYETKDKKAIGEACEKTNSCALNERCEDTCQGRRCVSIYGLLDGKCLYAEQSPNHPEYPASKAFDGEIGLQTSYSATFAGRVGPHWLKASFHRRVFISEIELVNRQGSWIRSHNNKLNITTSLRHSNGDSSITKENPMFVFVEYYRIFPWMAQADVLLIQKVEPNLPLYILTLDEVFIRGYIVYV